MMVSEKGTTVTFTRASPVNPSCLGRCSRSWVNFPGNVDVANLEPLPESELLVTTTVSAIITSVTSPSRRLPRTCEHMHAQTAGIHRTSSSESYCSFFFASHRSFDIHCYGTVYVSKPKHVTRAWKQQWGGIYSTGCQGFMAVKHDRKVGIYEPYFPLYPSGREYILVKPRLAQ